MILIFIFLIVFGIPFIARAASILIPMYDDQKDHLKSYGIAFWVLKNGGEVDWRLNYRGGRFRTKYEKKAEDEWKIRCVSYELIAYTKVNKILNQISDPSVNMDMVKPEKVPRIAVYAPKNKFIAPDGAVILVLKYAEIPFETIYDEEVLRGDMPKYDWLHLHHENEHYLP